MSLVLLLLMTATNLYSVNSYGEFEYWFAGIKVAAIVVFLILGTLFVLGLWPGHSLDFSNLYAHGGFFPNGVGAIFSGIVVVIFSMVGAEIATIAAAESAEPERAIVRATNSVVLRICIFFVGSIFLLAVILPWNSKELGASAYVAAFEQMGIGWAANIMNAVVLTAVLSCLNSGLYTASRMLFVLAARREAPARLLDIGQRGVPVAAILSSTADRLSLRRRRLRLARHRVPVPAELLGCDHPVRLPADRRLPAGHAAEDPARAAAGEDVVLPVLTLLTIAAMVMVLVSMGVATIPARSCS